MNSNLKQNHSVKKLLIVIFAAFLLSGCSTVESLAKKQMISSSNIEDDKDYEKYQSIKDNETVDENGYYVEKDEQSSEQNETNTDKSGIHVAFGSNNLLTIEYYSDKDLSNHISVNGCYLNKGDSIYSSDPVPNSSATNKYFFDRFKIYSVENGKRELIGESTGTNNLVFTIPSNYEGKEIVIMPLGRLENRIISLNTVICDEKGELLNNDFGIWKINKEVTKEETASIDPSKSYSVEYDFSSLMKDYYIERTYPETFSTAYLDQGTISFIMQNSDSDVDHFDVYLRKFTNLTIENKKDVPVIGKYGIVSLSINEMEEEIDKDKYTRKLSNGDSVEIEISNGFKIVSNSQEDGLSISDPVSVDNGKKYIVTINSTINFSPILTVTKETATQGEYIQRQIDNGRLIVALKDGSEVTQGDIIDDSTEVTVIIKPNSGYYVTGKNVKGDYYEKNWKYIDFNKNVDSIINDHAIEKYVVLMLDENDDHGECEYRYNNKPVNNRISLKNGEQIELKYTLTDPDYHIVRQEGISSLITDFFSKNSETVKITVNARMDGKTIKRSDYIAIEKN